MSREPTPYEKNMLAESIKRLEAVITMASANFPRDTGISVTTSGSSPSAACTISPRTLQILIDAGRKVLEGEQ